MSADRFKLKRGSTAAVAAYTPAQAEPVFDVDLKQLRIGDGVTLGGQLVAAPLTPFIVTLLDDTSAATARTTLGAQQTSNQLSYLSAVTPAANTLPYYDTATSMSATSLTAFSRTLLAAATAAAARGVLVAAASGANSDITSLSGLTTPLSITQGGTGSTSASTSRTALGAAASGANSDITSLSGLSTALSLVQGGTGSSTPTGARSNLSAAASGANSDITSLSGLTTPLSLTQGGTGAAPQAFTNFTLQNGWTVIAGCRAAYRKVLDMVQIEMQIISGTATDSTVLANLPVGFRPAFPINTPVQSGPNTTPSTTVAVPRVSINTNGDIVCQNCSSAPGIRFIVTIPTS